MKPYTSNDNAGRKLGGDDIHHRTADLPRAGAKKVAKVAKHGARQETKRLVREAVAQLDNDT